MADGFEFSACCAGRCLYSQNINKVSNKPAKRYERIIQGFYEHLATLDYLPSYLTSTNIGHHTFSINTAISIKIANWLSTRSCKGLSHVKFVILIFSYVYSTFLLSILREQGVIKNRLQMTMCILVNEVDIIYPKYPKSFKFDLSQT